MTDKEVLTGWVNKAIEGGWEVPRRETRLCFYWSNISDTASVIEVEDDIYYLPDLIADASFMRAVYGDGKCCCMEDVIENNEPCKTCSASQTPYPNCYYVKTRYLNKMQSLIILADDERLEYIKKGVE